MSHQLVAFVDAENTAGNGSDVKIYGDYRCKRGCVGPKRVFESFSEICQNADCGVFIGSSQSYAKNLLYLKDQLKDLAGNEQLAKGRLTN